MDYRKTKMYREKMSKAKMGHPVSQETILKIVSSRRGYKHSDETKRKIGEKSVGRVAGDKHHNWKGGISSIKEYRNWVKNRRNRLKKLLVDKGLTHTFGEWELLKRQYGYVCPCCQKPEPLIKLTEDHIIPLSGGGSDLIENIQPLCLSCNVKKHTKVIKYRKGIE